MMLECWGVLRCVAKMLCCYCSAGFIFQKVGTTLSAIKLLSFTLFEHRGPTVLVCYSVKVLRC